MYKALNGFVFLLIIGIINYFLYQYLIDHRFKAIILHHSASFTDNYTSIKRYHKKKHNWRDAGYHLILSNGSTDVPLGYLEKTERYNHLSYALATKSRYHNLRSLHICVVGNYERVPVPDQLVPALAHALNILKKRYHIQDRDVYFHRDIGTTLCPGRFMTKAQVLDWMAKRTSECLDPIRSQQKQVIKSAGFSVHTLPKWYIFLSGTVVLIVSLMWCFISYLFALMTEARNKTHSRAGVGNVPERCAGQDTFSVPGICPPSTRDR